MTELNTQLADLNTRAASLTGQDSSIPEAARLMQSLGHQFRLEKANTYNEIQMEINRRLSSGATIDEITLYLKGLYEAGKDLKLPAGSKFDDIKAAAGENWKKYFLAKAAGEILGEIGRPAPGAPHSQFQKLTEPLIAQLRNYNEKKADAENLGKLIKELGEKSFADIAELRTYLEELSSTSSDESLKRVASEIILEIDNGSAAMTDAQTNTIGNTPGMPSNAPDSGRVATHSRILERVKTGLGKLKTEADSELKAAEEAVKPVLLGIGAVKTQEEVAIKADIGRLASLIDSVEKRVTQKPAAGVQGAGGNVQVVDEVLLAAWNKLGVQVDFSNGVVTEISQESPLFKQGLRKGDRILWFNEVKEKYSSAAIASVDFSKGSVDERRKAAHTVALAFDKKRIVNLRFKRDGEDGVSIEITP